MNFKKIIIFVLVGLIALFFIVALILPSALNVSESKIIKADDKVVYRQVNILKNWEPWSPFLEADPSMSLEYQGAESGIGARVSWTSNNIDNGMLEIVGAKVFRHLKIDVQIGDHHGEMAYDIEPYGDSTGIVWSFTMPLSYPWERYLGIFMKPQLQKTFKDGLVNLAYIAEQFETTLIVHQGSLEPAYALSIVDSASFDNLQQVQRIAYQEIADYVNANGAEIIGPAYCIFYRYNPKNTVVFEVGYPVNQVIDGKERIHMVNTPSGGVVSASHFGAHTGLMDAHSEIQKYIRRSGLKWNGPPWEVYVTDTQLEPDTSRWQTKVFYPIEE